MTMDTPAIATVPARRSGDLAYHLFVPESATASGRASLVISVHGISRNALEQIEAFVEYAAVRGHVVMAPCFDTRADADYQRLGRRGRGRRADLVLDRAIARLAETTDIRFDRRFLFGFSGGGQFVHRYLMAHPDRVDGAVVAAAGWYTFPDAGLAYPFGLRVGGSLPGVRLEARDFLRVPVLAVVGSLDVERDESVRTTPKVDDLQGVDRRERARRWLEAMRAAARRRSLPARHELLELEGVGHSFSDCADAGLVKETFAFFDSIGSAA